jgi:RNA polymerase sigma-70 factor (ECF subfamily)
VHRSRDFPTGCRDRGILGAVTTGATPDLATLLAHADWVRGLSRQLCRDEHAADDAAQDTMLAALGSPPTHATNLRGFLATLLRNGLRGRARGQRRAAQRERAVARADFSEAAADAAARAELHQFLVQQVLALPEPQRAVVLLHYFEGEDVASLGRRLSLSPDAVRSHLRRGRDTLRSRLRRDELHGAAFAAMVAAPSPGAPAVVPVLAFLTMNMKLALLAGAAALLVAAVWLIDPFVSRATVTSSAVQRPSRSSVDTAGDTTPKATAPLQRDEQVSPAVVPPQTAKPADAFDMAAMAAQWGMRALGTLDAAGVTAIHDLLVERSKDYGEKIAREGDSRLGRELRRDLRKAELALEMLTAGHYATVDPTLFPTVQPEGQNLLLLINAVEHRGGRASILFAFLESTLPTGK